MEDGSREGTLPPYARNLLLYARSKHLIFKYEIVHKAFHVAEKVHRDQKRKNGHPHLQHCLDRALSLANIRAGPRVVAAALLHDTIKDSSVTYDHLRRSFGAEVTDLVHAVSKISQLSHLARENDTADKNVEADRLQAIYLAIGDARAVLIKLADVLHNMMTLDVLPSDKQQRFAKETLEIFVPLANKLGLSTWKAQLEDLCFKHLHPDKYNELASEITRSFDKGVISSSIKELEQALKARNVPYHFISGRRKSLYGIYCKVRKKKNLDVDGIQEIYDILGLRVIVETEEDCYEVLRIVREQWQEVPGRFKDYIKDQKSSGYQSLHTVVKGEGIVSLEVQIRTKSMHEQAENGCAAHWMYKEEDCKHPSFLLMMIEWLRLVITCKCPAMSKGKTSKPQCSDGPVFVIVMENKKMSVQEFPANSSVMDLLEKYGPGSEELRPRLNNEPVRDTACKLKMGDEVVLTPARPDMLLMESRVCG